MSFTTTGKEKAAAATECSGSLSAILCISMDADHNYGNWDSNFISVVPLGFQVDFKKT